MGRRVATRATGVRPHRREAARVVVAIVAIGISVGAVQHLVRTGEAGSRAVWTGKYSTRTAALAKPGEPGVPMKGHGPHRRSTAPDFTLPGWYDGVADFTLSSRRGNPTVLAFYPGDERLVCTRQLCTYFDNISDMHLFDADVWGISRQSVESHRDFAGARKLKMPLLTDIDNAVAHTYGIAGPLGVRRSVFVIDASGQSRGARLRRLVCRFRQRMRSGLRCMR